MHDTLISENDSHKHSHAQTRFAVIPPAEKLNADMELAGRGVRIAFLDSGFYPHPDFIDRVVAFYDISGEEQSLHAQMEPKGHHWHGTQTVVSCAGDGSLSGGVYRGLAHKAELILVKVSKDGRIEDKSIEEGLRWIIENREKYEIRVLNMSLGGDMDLPSNESRINQLVEELTGLGVVVTVAVGNSAESCAIPPASAPSAITVGGYSDENQFRSAKFDLYHSSFGRTADGIIKPEIIAPAMFVAAPILPETREYEIAEALSLILAAPGYLFRQAYLDYWRQADLPDFAFTVDEEKARSIVEQELYRRKIVSTHYQHVDGTSFAAPITASVVAQMLEANPDLNPGTVKNIIVSTASRLSGFPAIRQGFGVLNAGLAVQEALRETHFLNNEYLQPKLIDESRIIFYYHNDSAETVHLVGEFNEWGGQKFQFAKCLDGLWKVEIPCLPSGSYLYKFVVDGRYWAEDTNNRMKEPDGYGGFNSILNIE
ncbi:MAG: S8 family serine peptidase [Blastocatellia bacterium]